MSMPQTNQKVHKDTLQGMDIMYGINQLAQIIAISAKTNSPYTIKIRQIIDVFIQKCNKNIADLDKEYYDFLKKRMLNKQ